jgi:hypothetical protein
LGERREVRGWGCSEYGKSGLQCHLDPRLQIWVSFATFELSIGQEDCVEKARNIYREAHKALKAKKEERLMLLDEWAEFEVS